MQAVLNAPRCTFVIEVEAVTTPGMTDKVVDGTEPVERATEFTVQQWMEPLSNGHRRGDLQNSVRAYRTDQLFVTLIWSRAVGERNSNSPGSCVSGKDPI